MKTIKEIDLIGSIGFSDASGGVYKIESARHYRGCETDYVALVADDYPFDDEGNEIEVKWCKTILTKREVEKIFKAKIIDDCTKSDEEEG